MVNFARNGRCNKDTEQAYLSPPSIVQEYADWHDVCPHPRPEGFDGLAIDWTDHGRIFCNPPWGNVRPWVEKAIQESSKGCRVHMLLPADTSTRVFHELLLPCAQIEFIQGQVKFWHVRCEKYFRGICLWVKFE